MDAMRIDQVQLVGVGGVGIGGIARVAFDQGMRVSGTDQGELHQAAARGGHRGAHRPRSSEHPRGNPVIVVHRHSTTTPNSPPPRRAA
ncbi:MAG: hypothetical protein ACLTMP_10415 [Eggerthella lenta]